MIAQTQRLKAARRIYLGREGAPTAGDRWFSLYLIAFVTGFYVVPIAYVIGEFLSDEFAVRITSESSIPYITGTVAVLGIAALWCGRLQGPVFLTPFLAHTLLATEMDRRRVLARPALARIAGAALVLCAAASVGLFALTHTGVWDWGRFWILGLTALFGGLHLGLLAFLGQRLRIRWLVPSTAVILIIAVLEVFVLQSVAFSPFGWAAALWAGGSAWFAAALALTAGAGVVLLTAEPAALGRLPARRVLRQSRRLSDARLFSSTGNVNDAVELFRSRPRHWLHGAAVSTGPEVLSGLRQDLLAALRSPLSIVSAVVLVPSGAALLTVVSPVIGASFQDSSLVLSVPAGVLGALLLFLGTGSVSEGWRQLKNEFDAAALFGRSASAALSRRLPWPVLSTVTLSAAGAGAVVVLSGPQGPGLPAMIWSPAMAAVVLAARFFQSMRSRDIPVEFLAPTVIPGGVDLSAVKIVVWLGDGLILTITGILGVIVLPWEPMTLLALLGVLILIVLVWGWARTGQRLFAQAPRKAA